MQGSPVSREACAFPPGLPLPITHDAWFFLGWLGGATALGYGPEKRKGIRMVRFQFDLPDSEAQNLMFIIQKDIEDAKIASAFGTDVSGKKYNDAERKWFAENAEYVEKEILQVILSGQSRVAAR
jgi:hypothetical protein